MKTLLGRVLRDIERKGKIKTKKLKEELKLAKKLLKQERKSKKKIYSIHEPQVECISKGKVNKRYEFGNKVGYVVTGKGKWIVGAEAYKGNPYDGHTLRSSIEQAEKIMNRKIEQATCDLGYRGHGIENREILIVPRKKKKAGKTLRNWWKRRNAIEPIIGHNKSEHRLDRNYLSGELGDELNVLLAASGFNIKKLIRAFCLWLRSNIFQFFKGHIQQLRA